MSLVLSTFVVLLTGCQQGEPGVDADESPTAAVERSGLSMLLGAGDLGSGWHEDDARTGLPPWPWEQDDCPNYLSSDYTAKSHRRAAVERYYRLPDGSSPAHHVVETYEPGWAEQNVDDVRQVLRRCASYVVHGATVSFDIVDSQYLGGVGLLVRGRIYHSQTPATTRYFVMLKRGETVSTVSLPDLGDQAAVDSIAAKAVARLG
ncbi:hypothetical protein [Micromonospora sp. NPDC005172]|uniref:hypothetical protein n=1 Tax=Micromonospora sp. NPDC005172 TaxID=3156867 RepID=UPI0033B50338